MKLTLALSTSTMIDTYQTRKDYWAFTFLNHNIIANVDFANSRSLSGKLETGKQIK